MKYEFKATGRVFLPMFGALLIVAAFSRLFVSLSFKVPSAIGIIVSVIMIIGIFVMTFLLTIQRFNKNLLGSEGYLMFTLPVSTDSLIFSKLLTAAVWNIASVIIVFTAISIMAMTGFSFREMAEAIQRLLRSTDITDLNFALYVIEVTVSVLVSLLAGILTLYACMALSLLVNKHRGLFAFGAFVVINILLQTAGSILLVAGGVMNFENIFLKMQLEQQIHMVAILMIVLNFVIAGIFYVVTKLMLKYKLNLD